jgi:hypothetical protein
MGHAGVDERRSAAGDRTQALLEPLLVAGSSAFVAARRPNAVAARKRASVAPDRRDRRFPSRLAERMRAGHVEILWPPFAATKIRGIGAEFRS